MSVHTRSQKLAQAAYSRIERHGPISDEFLSFAKKFPALIHTCGLVQAVAFAQAKGTQKGMTKPPKPEMLYLEDLAEVLAQCGYANLKTPGELGEIARSASLSGYLRLSRDAIDAAGWLKRYSEAAGEDV